VDIECSKIFVSGHNGMVGSAVMRGLHKTGANNLLTADRAELDLTDQAAVHSYMDSQKPEIVIIAAARVGGINANNTYPAEFIYQNLMMELNLIHSAYQSGCTQLLFLGTSCIYPKLAEQPMVETALLDGYLEPTNEPYAIAKIAGIKLCESYNRQYGTDYRSLMPTNLYGIGDNFREDDSHVIPALMRRIHDAKCSEQKEVSIWGTGSPMRELLHVDDLAEACLHIMELSKDQIEAVTAPMNSHINVGTGVDVTIKELAELICKVVGYTGELSFDTSKPDGTPRKLLDVSKLNALGWQANIELEAGLKDTYAWFLNNQATLRQ
jgi:GDP-L-fucose synthase